MSVEDNDDDIDEKNKEKMEDKSSKQREEKQDDIDDDGLSTGNLFGPREPEVTAQYPRISGLTISILEKKGLALTLIADHIFSPALALSDAIYTGTLRVFGQRVLELGCGTGLVGLIALVVGDASYVCLTDYDDPSILACPRTNVRLNAGMLSGKKGRCDVVPHTWGTDTANLITDGRYDIVVLADILWYTSSHADILQSIDGTLSSSGTVWIASGKYTTSAPAFFALATATAQWRVVQVELGEEWVMPDVQGIANLSARKANCWCWKMQRGGDAAARVVS